MQRETERDLSGAWRQGNLPAAQEFVRARQTEVLALAYLLTGDRDRALGLARAAFLKLFGELASLDADTDRRERLLAHVGHCFLRGDYEATQPEPTGPTTDEAPQKYSAENQRERALAALGRLNDPERTALLLSDMSGIDPYAMNALNQHNDDLLTVPVETARDRLRQSLDVAEDGSLRPILIEAGFDGPKDDLWPLLTEPLAAIQQRVKRKGRLLTLSVAGAAFLMAVVTIATIFGPNLMNGNNADAAVEVTPTIVEDDLVIASAPPARPTPTPTPTPLPAGDVSGGLMLAQTYHGANSDDPFNSLEAYDPTTNEMQPLLEDGERLAWYSDYGFISPDGEQIVVILQAVNKPESPLEVVAFDAATFERQWETEISTVGDPGAVRMDAVVTSDRVYVVALDLIAPDSATIVALDRRDGSPREKTTIDLASFELTFDFQGSIFLFTPPDGWRLTFAFQIQKWTSSVQMESLTVFYNLALPTLTETSRVITQTDDSNRSDDRMFNLWDAKLTPDGNYFYTLTTAPEGNAIEVTFFDLRTAAITSLPLPFVRVSGEDYLATTSILSPDGRKLYVIHHTDGYIAIVNLDEQRIERAFPLDTGTHGERLGIGRDRFMLSSSNAISPDGSRLFIVAVTGDPTEWGTSYQESGVWVINLTQWRIVDFWPVQGQANRVYSVPEDNAILIARNSLVSPPQHYVQTISRRNARTGEPLVSPAEVPAVEGDGTSPLTSLFDMYRQQHGRSPSVNGTAPSMPTEFSTLPRIEAEATSDVVPAGVAAAIEVHILDPATGEALDSFNPDVRFDRSSGVMMILRSEEQGRQIVVPAKIESGIYRGSVVLPVVGEWSIDVAVTGHDGTVSLSSNAGSVNVAPTFAGNDGRLYQFEVTADPEQPVVDEETAVRLRLVDIEHGATLPDDVGLAIEQPALEDSVIESMPERIDIVFTVDDGSGSYRTALLYRTAAGLYEGTTDFWAPGTWTAEIRFQPPGGHRIMIPAGAIEVE